MTLSHEMTLRKIAFIRQHAIGVEYKGRILGKGELDFLVGGCLVVELKAVEQLHPGHTAQVISYLRATGLILGLLTHLTQIIIVSLVGTRPAVSAFERSLRNISY
jgi:GxxExxY protein